MSNAEHYEVLPLTPSQASQAFPLLQSVYAEATLDAWLRFARDMDPASGTPVENRIMVLRSCAGWLFGMFTYLIVPHLVHGRVLDVDNVVLVDLGNRRSLSRVLLERIDEIARTQRCGGIHFRLSPGHDFLADAIRSAVVRDAACCEGRERDGRWICRSL
jgi:hypothetical protein